MGTQRAGAALAAWLSAVALVAGTLGSPAPPATAGTVRSAAAAGTLVVSPDPHYAGQLLTWSGSLGVPGRHRIRLQKHLNRAGDTWEEVPASERWTAEDGSFSFRFPAPAMRGISYRVVGGGTATEGHRFWPDLQEVALKVRSRDRGLPPGVVVAGERFRVVVDTAAASSVVLPGRQVTLQRREGDGWRTLATRAADDRGKARFRSRAAQTGEVVYRARLEDWTENGDAVGWFPSFPTYVEVLRRHARASAEPTSAPSAPAADSAVVPASASPTASSVYGWRGKLYDFAWAYGESLTSPPYGGSRRHAGWWDDRSDGSGRVYLRNGGLEIATSADRRGPGDLGSAWATLREQPATHGRWEVRHRSETFEQSAGRYRVLIELVPDVPPGHVCDGHVITIAELDPLGSTARLGVTAGDRAWSRSVAGVPQGRAQARNYGVEVTPRRITWFMDGAVVGMLREPAAIPTVPMTVRLRLAGEPEREMNATRLLFDWVRSWDLSGGTKPPRGPRLREQPDGGAC